MTAKEKIIRTAVRAAIEAMETAQTQEEDQPDLITVKEAARRLSVSRVTIYNLFERGVLSYRKIGTARRIPLSDVERIVREGCPAA